MIAASTATWRKPVLGALAILVCLVMMGATTASSEALDLPGLRRVSKPPASGVESDRRAHPQPSVPDNYTEVPYMETAPEPVLSPEEQKRGYLLFQRPIVDPVHPNTHPLAHERLRGLVAFATPGEFEPLTFSIYPVRDLQNLRVRVSSLRSQGGEIPSSDLTVRLATHWNVGYPRYTSRETFRRVPELLERVAVHSSPARECQRWWITVHVPEHAEPGLYRGAVTVWDDGYGEAVEIPVALRVLGFRLQADPAKRYSAYYHLRNRVQFEGRDEAFIHHAMGNEYRAMVDLGLDMMPTLYLRYDREQGKIVVQHMEELERMRAAGLAGPVPVAGGNAIEVIYQETTPGGQRASHWRIEQMPPPEFYERVTEAFRALEKERRAKGWPELICCPLDEVDASRAQFGARVYKAVRDAGIRTYITKNPLAADAVLYRPGVDIWCSQPYSTPYEKIIAQDRFEYWSYPNHNAGEIKDRRVMCKGGRMTYGFGFWRSGYTALIPWHWAWTPAPDQFDYLRGSRSGCGQRLGDDGEVIPAVYWECFREGRDDARYLYTLQQAIWEREGSPEAKYQRLVAQGKGLLQQTWDDIEVQEKYLADDMWPSAEFNARRWELAALTDALLRFPAVRTGTAPSVLVEDTRSGPGVDEMAFIDEAMARGDVEVADLGGDFAQWVNVTGEGEISVTPKAGEGEEAGLRWQVRVDHQTDGGGEVGDYAVGWPRIFRAFDPGELDMSRFDYLLFRIRIDSNRDEVADDTTPVGFTVHSNDFYEVGRDLGGRQRVWLPVLFPIPSMVESVGRGPEPWRSVEKIQFFISEGQYADGTKLTFDVADVELLRFKQPMLRRLEVPQHVPLPLPELAVGFEVMGMRAVRAGTHEVEAALRNSQGETVLYHRQDLAAGGPVLLSTGALVPGTYTLGVTLLTDDGTPCSHSEQQLICTPGPLAQGDDPWMR